MGLILLRFHGLLKLAFSPWFVTTPDLDISFLTVGRHSPYFVSGRAFKNLPESIIVLPEKKTFPESDDIPHLRKTAKTISRERAGDFGTRTRDS